MGIVNKFNEQQIKKMIDMYYRGNSMNKIANEMGCAHSVISYRLHKNRVKIRPCWAWKRKCQVKTEDLIKMYENGLSTPMIAEKVGLTNQSIWQRFIKAHYRCRTPRQALKLKYSTGQLIPLRREQANNWKGGRHLDKYGYVYEKINRKTVFEHRAIWEKHNGKISKGHLIHHLNGIRDDNRLENLCCIPRKRHSPTLIIEPYKKRIKELELQINRLTNRKGG